MEPVVAEVVAVLFAKVPEAPVPGAVNVTMAPETALPLMSVTVASSGLVNEAPTVADWPPPEVTAMLTAEPAVMLKLLAFVGAV